VTLALPIATVGIAVLFLLRLGMMTRASAVMYLFGFVVGWTLAPLTEWLVDDR